MSSSLRSAFEPGNLPSTCCCSFCLCSFHHPDMILAPNAAEPSTVKEYSTARPVGDLCRAGRAHAVPDLNHVTAVLAPRAAPTNTCGHVWKPRKTRSHVCVKQTADSNVAYAGSGWKALTFSGPAHASKHHMLWRAGILEHLLPLRCHCSSMTCTARATRKM